MIKVSTEFSKVYRLYLSTSCTITEKQGNEDGKCELVRGGRARVQVHMECCEHEVTSSTTEGTARQEETENESRVV